jgi:predicted TPR repeat methyltransferase
MKRDERQSSDLNISEAMAMAMELFGRGRFEEAEKLYRRVLETTPGQPDALYWLGLLLHRRNCGDEAVRLIRSSIELTPWRADRLNDLGNILFVGGEFAAAREAFEKSIAISPHDADSWNNLGAALNRLGLPDDAASAFFKAVQLKPDFIDALDNLGNLFSAQGRDVEAAEYLCRSFVLKPAHNQSKLDRGIAFYKLGRIEEAAEVYRQWTLEEPENPTAAHLYAACSGLNVPTRASDAYVEKTFDKYAPKFDESLGKLHYRGHNLIEAALSKIAKPAKKLVCLDAGCGTGLCGPLVAPYASRLTGVDLSSLMLVEAQKKGVYDELFKAEVTQYLREHADSFDLIVAADTMIYFGAADQLLKSAHEALRPGGLLIFTAERADDTSQLNGGLGYRLNPHGRYSHGSRYLNKMLTGAGFKILAEEPGVVRIEWGNPVACMVFTAVKTVRSVIRSIRPGPGLDT